MQILNHRQIQQKIKRLAIEIMERNTKEKELIIAGINNNGMRFAELLLAQLKCLSNSPFTLTSIQLNPANPVAEAVKVGLPLSELNGKPILVVDDVANTGRTLIYACKPLLNILPKKLETAVLIDRTHKSFPVQVGYKGLSLATTMREHITVDLSTAGAFEVRMS